MPDLRRESAVRHPLTRDPGRGPPSATAESGQTLVEVAVACVILVVVFGAGLRMSVDSGSAWSHIYSDTGAQHAVREGLRRITAEMGSSAPAHVDIIAGAASDALQFQVPVGMNDDDIVWGADSTAGDTVQYRVVDACLMREVVDGAGRLVGRSRRVVAAVDGLEAGAKSFTVARDGTLCTLTLRVRMNQKGSVWRKEYTTSVYLRN